MRISSSRRLRASASLQAAGHGDANSASRPRTASTSFVSPPSLTEGTPGHELNPGPGAGPRGCAHPRPSWESSQKSRELCPGLAELSPCPSSPGFEDSPQCYRAVGDRPLQLPGPVLADSQQAGRYAAGREGEKPPGLGLLTCSSATHCPLPWRDGGSGSARQGASRCWTPEHSLWALVRGSPWPSLQVLDAGAQPLGPAVRRVYQELEDLRTQIRPSPPCLDQTQSAFALFKNIFGLFYDCCSKN